MYMHVCVRVVCVCVCVCACVYVCMYVYMYECMHGPTWHDLQYTVTNTVSVLQVDGLITYSIL